MKNILYLIFSESPSSVVRAEIFRETYLKKGYKVNYYYDYSYRLNLFYKSIIKYKFFFIISLIVRIIRKIHILFKRFYLLNTINNYDAVIIVKYISPNFLNKIRKNFKKSILYDFDDAIWLPIFFGNIDFEKIIKTVDFISCDNSYLLQKSIQFNKKTFILNGPSAIEKFEINNNTEKKDKIVIGWIGSPSTIFYLFSIYEALEEIGSKYTQIELLIVGSGNDKSILPPFENIKIRCIAEYNEQKMIHYLKTFDIGLYPLFKNELSLGRGSLKAIIYMSLKIPVVASAIGGENENIIIDGINGFLAASKEQWLVALESLIRDPHLRKKIGNEGYQYVEKRYSIESCFNQLQENFLIHI